MRVIRRLLLKRQPASRWDRARDRAAKDRRGDKPEPFGSAIGSQSWQRSAFAHPGFAGDQALRAVVQSIAHPDGLGFASLAAGKGGLLASSIAWLDLAAAS